MKTIACFLALAAVTGCASTPHADNCVQRKIDATEIRPGVVVLGQHCSAWSFGPSAGQRFTFIQRQGETATAPAKP